MEEMKRGRGRPPKSPGADELLAALQVAPLDEEPVGDASEAIPEYIEEAPSDDMSDAPRDGRALWLYNPRGGVDRAYWRETRTFQKTQWVKVGFWAYWKGPHPVGYEPVRWAPVE